MSISTSTSNVGNKNISFHIVGRTDEDHTYDMIIPIGGGNITAKVTKLSNGKTKDCKVDLSELLTWEKAQRVFLGATVQATISRRRHHLIHKHLFLDIGQSTYKYPPTALMRVEGEFQGYDYLIELDIHQQNNCKGWIKSRQNNDYQPVELDFGGRSYHEIADHLANVQHDLDISIIKNGHNLALRVSLMPSALASAISQAQLGSSAPSASAQPHLAAQPKSSRPSSILGVRDARQLAQLVTIGDPLAYRIAHGMVKRFTNDRLPSEGEIQEVIELMDKMDSNDSFRILSALMECFSHYQLKDPAVLQGLAYILIRFQRINYQRTFEEASGKKSSDLSTSLETINRSHLVAMMNSLTGQLNDMHSQPGDTFLLRELLLASIALLDIMSLRQETNVAEDHHKAAYEAIAQFSGNADLRVDYLTQYGKQIFRLIKDDKTNIQSFLHRSYLVLRASAKIAAALDLTAPWKIVSTLLSTLSEIAPDLKEAFALQEFRKNWFVNLFAIRSLLFEKSPQAFLSLAQGLQQNYADVQKEMDFNNPFLLVGFIDLLLEVLRFPHFGNQDEEVKEQAVGLLLSIYCNNRQGLTGQPFILEKPEHRIQIQELVAVYLHSIQQQHPQSNIRAMTQSVITRENITTPSRVVPLLLPQPTTELFQRTVREDAPILLSMQRLEEELNRNPQLQKERPYFIPLDAKSEGSSAIEPLKTKIDRFLNSQDVVLTIRGEGGAGKSLGIKIIAQDLLKEYKSEGYFPIYSYLPSFLRDPYHENFKAFLRDKGIDIYQEKELREKKVVLILDSYDEVNFKVLGERDQNIYINNGFGDWPSLKVIFLHKTGAGERERFKPAGGNMQTVIISPFDPDKVLDYVNKYVQLRTEEHQKNPQEFSALTWSLDQYRTSVTKILQSSNEGWKAVIANPFRLKVWMEVAPDIVKKYAEENKMPIEKVSMEDMFTDEAPEVISNRLFEAYACILARRASLKTGYRVPAKAFLNYEIDVAILLQRLGNNHFIAWPNQETEEENREFLDKLKDSFKTQQEKESFDKLQNLLNKDHEHLYKECLIPTEHGWSFMHRDYWLFLITAIDPAIRKMILEAIPEQKFDTRFGQTST